MSDEPLKFNRSRHDDNVAARLSADLEMVKAGILRGIQLAYDNMAKTLAGKRKPKVADVDKFLADIRAMVIKNAAHPALSDWLLFTLSLIDEKEEEMRLTGFNQRNCFMPWTGAMSTPELPKGIQAPIVRYTFSTYDDFCALEFVAGIMATPGFVGFLLDGVMMVAFFGEGETRNVGRVSNGIGLEKVPSVKQYQQALLDHEKGKKKK